MTWGPTTSCTDARSNLRIGIGVGIDMGIGNVAASCETLTGVRGQRCCSVADPLAATLVVSRPRPTHNAPGEL